MGSWADLSEEFREDAKLLGDQRARSSISRIYYSVYAALVDRMDTSRTYAHGWKNPAHSELVRLVDQIAGLKREEKEVVRTQLKELFRARVSADYDPSWQDAGRERKECFRGAYAVFAILGVKR